MTALTALTISAHSRVRPIVAPISLAGTWVSCRCGTLVCRRQRCALDCPRGNVRQCESRSPIRPVLKHGPWSVAIVRVEECSKLYIGVMKVKTDLCG